MKLHGISGVASASGEQRGLRYATLNTHKVNIFGTTTGDAGRALS
jgi:hypothetical protein